MVQVEIRFDMTRHAKSSRAHLAPLTIPLLPLALVEAGPESSMAAANIQALYYLVIW